MGVGLSTVRTAVTCGKAGPMKHTRLLRYALACALLLALYLTRVAAQASITEARNDGTVLLNGQPFFPFGLYPRLLNWQRTTAEKLTDLQVQRQAGFNVAHIAMAGDGQDEQFQYAAANGLYLYASEPFGPTIVATAPYLSQQAALFAYEICDDCDNGRFSYAQLQQVNNDVKAIDQNHLTYLTLTGYTQVRRDSAAEWMQIGDSGSPQVYPITPLADAPNPPEGPLYQSYQKMLTYQRAGEEAVPVRPVFFTGQAFVWDTIFNPALVDPNARYPTPAELRNMVYGGVIAGASGVSVYNYHPGLVNTQPALWGELQALNADMQTISGPLLDGSLRRMFTGNPFVAASSWTFEGELYVLVANLSTDAAQNIDLQLPPAFFGDLTPLASRIPNLLNLNGTRLQGALPARGVQAYKVGYGPGAGDPTTYYRLVNRNDASRKLFQHIGRVNYGTLPVSNELTHWAIDTIAVGGGAEVYRLRNRQTGRVIGTSATRDYAEVRDAVSGDATTQWDIVPTSNGFVRFVNVADASQVLHTENSRTYAQFSSVPASFWTSQWTLEPVQDVTAPTPASNLTASNIGEQQITLDWTRAGDDFTGVTYEVRVDGTLVGTTADATFQVTGLTCDQLYALSVLAVDAAGNVSPSATSSSAMTLACGTTTPLPVAFVSMAATPVERGIEVTWTTASETDNDRFVVERRSDAGDDFTDVGTVRPNPSLRYRYLDATARPGIAYLYRVRQVDTDGNSEHSLAVAAQLRASAGEMVAYPNPTTGWLTLTNAPGEVTVRDVTGRKVNAPRLGNELDLTGLAPGRYSIESIGPRGNAQTVSILLQ